MTDAEQEMAAIRAILDTIQPFPASSRKRILGYVQHYLKTSRQPGKATSTPTDDTRGRG